jgi:hypothetical protein
MGFGAELAVTVICGSEEWKRLVAQALDRPGCLAP